METDHTLEHIVPMWAQRRYELFDQQLFLLNKTALSYRQLTVPCCQECNNNHLKPLEDALSTRVERGRQALLELHPETVFLWLSKIFYGILYKEHMLLFDRTNPKLGSIVSTEDLRMYDSHRRLLQRIRGEVAFEDFLPGSVFLFDAHSLERKRYEWYLADNVQSLFIGIRVGNVVLAGLLADGGAQALEEVVYSDYYSLHLHPIQIKELFALMSYKSTLATRTPKYISSKTAPRRIWQMSLGGLSARPFFEGYDTHQYAKVLSHFTGIELAELFQPPDQVRTWLRNPSGALNHM